MIMKNCKLLCFTNSYRRPYYLYNTINSILNQKYKKFDYVVGISIDHNEEKEHYNYLLSDFLLDNRLKIFFHSNLDQHNNYLYPIRQTDYSSYNLFAKIDDDDIYKTAYLDQTINIFKKSNADIISSNIQYEINNEKIYHGVFDNVGGYWTGDLDSDVKFGMPFSYVFNLKCLNVLLKTTMEELRSIHPFEDPGWRTKWRQAGIKSHVVQDSDLAIYHIHGKNISSSKWLIDDNYTYIDNDIFTMCLCKHIYWESYIVLNKANSTIYNIKNNDFGTYNIENNILTIKWDKYKNMESFVKKMVKDGIFTYEYET